MTQPDPSTVAQGSTHPFTLLGTSMQTALQMRVDAETSAYLVWERGSVFLLLDNRKITSYGCDPPSPVTRLEKQPIQSHIFCSQQSFKV